MKRKIWAVLLTIIMLVNSLPTNVFAAEPEGAEPAPAAEACTHPGNAIEYELTADMNPGCTDHGFGMVYYCGDCGAVRWTGSWNSGQPYDYTSVDPEIVINVADGKITLSCKADNMSRTFDMATRTVVDSTDTPVDPPVDPPHEHSFTVLVSREDDFDCEKGGKVIYKCTGCEETNEVTVAAGEHHWVEGDTVAPTCLLKGYTERTCSVCGKTERHKYVNALGHTYGEGTVVAPTCEANGYTVYVCSVCHEEVHDDFVPMLGHNWGEWTVVSHNTTTLTQERVCKNDPAHKETREIEATETAHNYVLAEEGTTAPNCAAETNGNNHYVCSDCGKELNVAVPYEHNLELVAGSRVEPTCKDAGSETYQCINEGCTHTETVVIPANGVHSFEVVRVTADCTHGGDTTSKCGVCGTTKMEYTPALGHDYQVTDEKAATCEEEGYQVHTCQRVTGHDAEGNDIICGDSYTVILEKVDHNYVNHFCTICGKTYPVVQEVLDDTETLPANTDGVNIGNALAVYNKILEIEEKIDAIDNSGTNDEKDAVHDLVNEELLEELKAEALTYLIHTSYHAHSGEETFNVEWNDNLAAGEVHDGIDHTNFMEKAKVVLSYEIVSEDGSTVVASGVLNTSEDADAAFGFIGAYLPHGEELLELEVVGADYKIETNPKLPIGYTSTYTDYTTGESYSKDFRIRYSVTVENPVPNDYITTYPTRTTEPVTIQNGGTVIFTKMADWEADLEWKDDNNRSAEGGTSAEHTPRVDADTLKAASTVYVYKQGYNVTEGTPVTGDYSFVISDDESKIMLKGLPAFDNDGDPLAYYISQKTIPAANADVVPGNIYRPSYRNTDNFAAKNNGVYNGGTLTELLYNTEPFRVNKVWSDGKTPAERPNANYYIWRIVEQYDADGNLIIDTEFSYAVPNTSSTTPVTKTDFGTTNFQRELTYEGSGETFSVAYFPMYDSEGRRYIYFGREVGVPGIYTVTIDNSEAIATGEVIEAFGEGYNTNYFLNNATITNAVKDRVSLPVSKNFQALSLQNRLSDDTPITATFLLQKKDENGNWVSANVETDKLSYPEKDVQSGKITIGDDNSITVTLSGFSAEVMSDSYREISASGKDNAFHDVTYRWVETGVSVNGVSAAYDPSLWVSNGQGGMVYNGDIIVNDGQTSTVIGDTATQTSGPDDTTALFNAAANSSSFTNILDGDYQVEIRKYWYDENGSIAGDESMKNVTVSFQVYRDDQPFEIVTMTYEDLVQGQDFWMKLKNYDRYDAEGREYRFKVEEVGVNGSDITWMRTENYDISVIEYPAGSGILVKRLRTDYVNAPNPGTHLEFDVEKIWLDDSDLDSRYPVVAGLFRIRDLEGNPITPVQIGENIVLGTFNNWYHLRRIQAAGENDSVRNYVIVELGILVGDHLVPVNTDLSMAEIEALIYGTTGEIGTVGTKTAVGENWDGLNYIYRTFEKYNIEDIDHPIVANYTLSNLRVGTQDYILSKTWKAGGMVMNGSFALFLGNQRIAEFDLVFDENNEGSVSGVTWVGGYVPDQSVKIEFGEVTQDQETGNYNATVTVTNLPKFNEIGEQLFYSIKEIKINGIDVNNGSCTVVENGISYTYSVSSTSGVEYSDNEHHRSPDVYTFSISNDLTGTYNIISNKVWRDANDLNRPDVCFSIYRMSLKDAGLSDLINVDQVDGDAVAAYIHNNLNKGERVITDRYWDTHINDYWWTCTINGMARYDTNGYPYVYYGVENIGSGSGTDAALYEGYYCNMTSTSTGYRPGNPEPAGDVLTTQEVFGVPNDDLAPMGGSVFIMADGVHTGPDGTYSSYYSATAVNRPEDERTVSGHKLWKMPSDWIVSADNMPQVEVDLYRSLKEISFSSFTDANGKTGSELYVEAILANAEPITYEEDGVEKTTTILNKQIVFYENGTYSYTFNHDINGDTLPRFDEWGNTYYYYTIEKSADRIHNFPANQTIYEDNDFNISNVFVSEPPYVEVSVEKVWQLSPEILARIAEFGINGISENDFAPAIISLYGIPLNRPADEEGAAEIPGARFDFRTITIRPTILDSDGDGNIDTVFTIDSDGDGKNDTVFTIATEEGSKNVVLKATYTFTDFVNDSVIGETEGAPVEKLPLYWLHNYGIHYYLTETHTNGYTQTIDGTATGTSTTETHLIDLNETRVDENGNNVWYNGVSIPVTNVYVGERTSFEVVKIWNDLYVDNADYRPDSITFTVMRKEAGVVDPDFSTTITLTKPADSKVYTWRGTINDLVKYAPSGKIYTYFVYSEQIKVDGEDVIVLTEGNGSKVIGNYTLTSFTGNNTLINTLNDDTKLTVSANKSWSVDGQQITKWSDPENNNGFLELREMGIFPERVQFIVERAELTNGTAGAYERIPASSYTDLTHTITVGGSTIVGHEVSLAAADETNFLAIMNQSMRFVNLPARTTDGNEYTYRVTEILYWADGTSTELTPQTASGDGTRYRGVLSRVEASVTDNGDVVNTLTNDIDIQKVRIAKLWDDDNGYDNTRPREMTVTIKPLTPGNTTVSATGMTFTLTTHGNQGDSDYYYSDYFYLPTAIPMTYGVTGAKYEITESYELYNGAEYTQTIRSDEGNVYVDPEDAGCYVLRITNTHHDDRKTIELTASKSWAAEGDWNQVVRPQVSYQLQYKDRTSGSWVSLTDETILNFYDAAHYEGAAQNAVQVVPAGLTVTWNDMYKYWADPNKDGEADKIEYRVIEIVDTTDHHSSYNQTSNAAAQQFTVASGTDWESAASASASITNTLQTKNLTLRKSWTKNGTTSTLTREEIEKLINLNAIPQSITFTVEYKLYVGTANETEWLTVPGAQWTTGATGSPLTYSTVELINGKSTGLKLPQYDMNGGEIAYRAYETKIWYKDGTMKIVDWTSDKSAGASGSMTTTTSANFNNAKGTLVITNDYQYRSISFTKTWIDENNRDGKRTDFQVSIYRDGQTTAYAAVNTGNGTQKGNAFVTVTKNDANNSWTVTFDMLPMYTVDSTATSRVESSYTWAETQLPGNNNEYVVSDSTTTVAAGNNTTDHDIENTHQPYRGTVTAAKIWAGDHNDGMDTRAEKVYLKLQYQNAAGNWVDVAHVDESAMVEVNGVKYYVNADGSYNETDAFTTSADGWIEVSASSAAAWTASWTNLPVNKRVNGTTTKISYRVIEGEKTGDTITAINPGGKLEGYTVSYTQVQLASHGDTKAANVTNTMDQYQLSVSKVWTGDSTYTSLVRPASVTFKVEYSKDGTTWAPIPAGFAGNVNADSTIVLTGSNNAGSWSKNVTGLPRMDAYGTTYRYRITETKITYSIGGQNFDVAVVDTNKIVGPYTVTSIVNEAAFSTSYAVSSENVLNTASVSVTKNWIDGNNRDGGEKAIMVQLYRVNTSADGNTADQKVGNAVELNKNNNWTYQWNNLPVRNNNAQAAGDVSEYYVVEIDQSSELAQGAALNGNNSISYTVAYGNHLTLTEGNTSATTITNSTVPRTLPLTATKSWRNETSLNVRPESITFKIQYRIGDNGTWTDMTGENLISATELLSADASKVYMTGETAVVQTLSESNNWTANWTGMVANVNVGGTVTPVYYRAVEIIDDEHPLHNYTNQNTENASAPVSYNSQNKSVTITNDLDRGSVTVTKQFNANNTQLSGDKLYTLIKVYKVLPESLTVTITSDVNADWAQSAVITFNEETKAYSTCTFEDLPTKKANGDDVNYTITDSAAGYVNVSCTEVNDINVTLNTDTSETIINTYEAGSLKVEKKWVDEDDRDLGRTETVEVELYRDNVKIDTVILSQENNWAYQWDNLPVYQNGSAAEKSVYSFKEIGENADHKYAGENGVIYTVTYSDAVSLNKGQTASSTITNTHDVYRGTVTVTKTWIDEENVHGSRPETITVTLQYFDQTDSQWKSVEKVTDVTIANTALEDMAAYTTTVNPGVITVTSTSRDTYTWNDLPVYFGGEKVTYRVIEDTVSGYKTAVYSVESITLVGDNDAKNVTVTNTQDESQLVIRKTWENVTYMTPVSAVFKVEYKHGDAAWVPYGANNGEYTVTVAAGEITLNGVPIKDAAGNDYLFRVSEKSITYQNADGTQTTIPATGSFLTDENGNETNIWQGQAGIYGGHISETITNGVHTFEAANNVIKGSLEVRKLWEDDHDRDGGRRNITVQLYRDGIKFGDPVTIHKADSDTWTYTYEDLPVYQNNANGTDPNKSVYTVRELAADGTEIGQSGIYVGASEVEYTVTYTDVSGVSMTFATVNDVAAFRASTAITNTHEIYLGSLTVTKKWTDEENLYLSRPEAITVTLQYSLDGTANWTKVDGEVNVVLTDLPDKQAYTSSRNSGTITVTTTDADTYTFNDLPVNYNGSAIYYRVVEDTVSGYKSAVYSVDKVNIVKTDEAYAAAIGVENELDTTSLTIKKVWEEVDYFTPEKATFLVEYKHGTSDWTAYKTNDNIVYVDVAYTKGLDDETLINGLPYVDGSGNAYIYRVSEVSVTYKTTDEDGNDVEVVVAASGSFVNDEDGNAAANWKGVAGIYESEIALTGTTALPTGELKEFVFTAENTVIKGSLNVGKIWDDKSDRDGGRKELEIELYRDDVYFTTLFLNASNEWAGMITDLPIYRDDSNGASPVKSVYKVVEKGEEDGKIYLYNYMLYEVEYSDEVVINTTEDADGTVPVEELTITNTHDILKLDVDAYKVWNDPYEDVEDEFDRYGMRPSITLRLEWTTGDPYSEDTEWTVIEKSDARIEDDETGTKVYTSSEPAQVLTYDDQIDDQTWSKAQWKDLPAFVNVVTAADDGTAVTESVIVYYRVTEIGEIPSSFISTMSSAVCYYDTYFVIEPGDGPQPFSLDDEEEQDDDDNDADDENTPADPQDPADSETEEPANPVVRVSVVNSLEGKTFMTVTKIFDDNEEEYYARPDEIEVKLQYAEIPEDEDEEIEEEDWTDVPENGTLVLIPDSEIPWSGMWLGLRDDLTYRVVEVSVTYGDEKIEAVPFEEGLIKGQVGGYIYESVMEEDEHGNVTSTKITNTLIRGKIEVTKTWEDAEDRDGIRPLELTFELYRDEIEDPIAVKTVKVTEGGIEECIFENLPVYKDASEELSEYYVVEKANTGYTITYEVDQENTINLKADDQVSLNITNTHEIELFKIESTKTWDDADNFYGLRPAEVELKLQYALDPESEEWTDVTEAEAVPASSEDDGLVVFTTSQLVQKLNNEDALDENIWGTVIWEDLPAYVLTEEEDEDGNKILVSAKVYYRITENEPASTAYGVIESDALTIDDADEATLTASGTVVDPLEDTVKVEAAKIWVDNAKGELEDYMADEVIVVLQYLNEDEEWENVPENSEVSLNADNEWTCTFEDLRSDLEYRVTEIKLVKDGEEYEVKEIVDKETEAVTDLIYVYEVEEETTAETDEDGNIIYKSLITNKLLKDIPKTGDTRDMIPVAAAAAACTAGFVILTGKKKKEEEEEA